MSEKVLGIDLGIGSCGWAVIEDDGDASRLIDMGSRTFDVPETDKERTPTNQLRRQHRGLRKVFRRRRQRMKELRALLAAQGLSEQRLEHELLDPWALRAKGLDRRLSGPEFACVLIHIAKHRGFRSNSKRDKGKNAPDESSKMLKAIGTTRERLKNWRTVGEMFASDPDFADRKRNRDGEFSRSILRDDQEREIHILFGRQRHFGNSRATPEFETAYIDNAFWQRPLADSEDSVGWCPMEPEEKRSAKHAPSFELFRFLSRLTALRVKARGAEDRPLNAHEIAAAVQDFGARKGITFKRLRTLVRLDDHERFDGVSDDDEGKRDVVSRTGDLAPGTYALRNVLGPSWAGLIRTPALLDRIAAILAFRDDQRSIAAGLDELGLEPLVLQALLNGVEQGEFGHFKGAAHLSAKACRAMIPQLMTGLVYSAAAEAAGYNHAARPATKLDEIANPIARKALTEALKQVKAVIAEYGLPDRIHVELARDVGKSKEERDEIKSGIEKRNKEKDRLRDEFLSTVGFAPRGAEDLMRFELWKEQKGRCLYTDREIPPSAVASGDNLVQVDHILPWSRSGDDSFINKTLCYAKANQDKKGRTPYEWFGADAERWDQFAAVVEGIKSMKGRKKRNYLLKDASVLEEKFRSRNLNDTRYATRLLLEALARLYPDDGKLHVFARPGALTDRLRRGWGMQSLKKGPDGKRLDDDRHHALDALIVAATSQSALQRLTLAFQEAEARGLHRDFSDLPQPWPDFLEQTKARFATILVSRAERRRARGKAHDATIRQIVQRGGETSIYERKKVDDKLKETDLERIKDPERNGPIIESLREWIGAGHPKDRRPLSPKGDPIAKIKLKSKSKIGVPVRGGTADRASIVRVDVFESITLDTRSRYYFIPVYSHHIVNIRPPNKIFTLKTEYEKWKELSLEMNFIFSIYPMSFIEVTWRERGAEYTVPIEGYFRGLDVNDGRMTISDHRSKDSKAKELQKRLSPTTLLELRKIYIDRLGRKYEIKQEIRTWHGVACT